MNEKEKAMAWLVSEYPHGVTLCYVDYRDSLDEHNEAIMQIIKEGYCYDINDWYDTYEHVQYIIDEYKKTLDSDIDEDTRDAIQEWCYEHDTSDAMRDLIRNTSEQVFFFETGIDWQQEGNDTQKILIKYGKSEKEKKNIKWVASEGFYDSVVSFYFKADISDLRDAFTSDSKYVHIDGAHIANVTRGNGSNWVSDEGCFSITVDKEVLRDTIALDRNGGGYGWGEIAGADNGYYASAGVTHSNVKIKKGHTYTEPYESASTKRERILEKRWNNTKKCSLGDMNIKRHVGPVTYSNEYPCGSRCASCGTFWID